jgi:hypothetical protein
MKPKLTLWAAGLALLAAALLLLVFHAQPGSARPSAAVATAPSAAASPAPQRHPRIEAAIRHLEEARRELEAAPAEFHGHRVKAIGHVNQAIEECNKALATGP